ncbi:hypothetical protein CLOM_g20269 [Closterium sp. NIES-68]|nr:hypothetical protein CLOM_g20269 [Closterium sp. NIES-68]
MRKRRRWRWGVLDWYLARSMAGPFAVAAGVAASVGVALGSLAEVARVAANTGAPLRLALLVALHHLPRFLALALPPACLAASLFAFSRLLAHNELAALAAGGVAWGRLLRAPVCVGVAAGALMLACHEHVIPWAMGRAQRMVEAAVTSDMASLPSQEHVLLREYGAHAQQHHDPLALLLTHLHPSSPLVTFPPPLPASPAASAGGAVAAAGKGGEGGAVGAGLWRVWYAGEVGGGTMRRALLLQLAPEGHVRAVLSAEHCVWQPHSHTWRLLNCCLLPLASPAPLPAPLPATAPALPSMPHTAMLAPPQPPTSLPSSSPPLAHPTAATASFALLQLEALDVPLASARRSSSPLASHVALPPSSLPRHLLCERARHLKAQLAWLQRQGAQGRQKRVFGRQGRGWEEQQRVREQRRRVREQRRRVAEAESDLVLRDASCASCAAYAVLGAVAVLVTAAPATATSTISTSISSIVRSSGGGQRGGSSGQPFQVGLVLAAAFHLLSAALAAAARSALLPPLLAACLPTLLALLLPPLLLGPHNGSGEAWARVGGGEGGVESTRDGEEVQ